LTVVAVGGATPAAAHKFRHEVADAFGIPGTPERWDQFSETYTSYLETEDPGDARHCHPRRQRDHAGLGGRREHALGIVESSGQYLYFGGRNGLNLDD